VLAAANFAVYRKSFAACFILEFQRNLLADRKTQSWLPTSSIVLPATTNYFDRAGLILLEDSSSEKMGKLTIASES